MTIIFEDEPGSDIIREVQSLREFMGELNYRVDATPELNWEGESDGSW